MSMHAALMSLDSPNGYLRECALVITQKPERVQVTIPVATEDSLPVLRERLADDLRLRVLRSMLVSKEGHGHFNSRGAS